MRFFFSQGYFCTFRYNQNFSLLYLFYLSLIPNNPSNLLYFSPLSFFSYYLLPISLFTSSLLNQTYPLCLRTWNEIENVVQIFLFHSLLRISIVVVDEIVVVVEKIHVVFSGFSGVGWEEGETVKKMKEDKDVAGVDEPLTCLSFFISFLFIFSFF